MQTKIEAEIRHFFEDAAGAKLDVDSDGKMWDADSNWGFDPKVLAAQIERVLERKAPNSGAIHDQTQPTTPDSDL